MFRQANNKNKLYIEYRVYFDPQTNQDLLHELAKVGQEEVYEMHEGQIDETDGPLPRPEAVTYEVVMVIDRDASKPNQEQAEGRFNRKSTKVEVVVLDAKTADIEIDRITHEKTGRTDDF